MKTERDCKNKPCIKGMYRRDLLKLAAAAGTGLFVTGCGNGREDSVSPTATPAAEITKSYTYSAEDFRRMAYCGIRCRESCPEKEYPDHCGGCKTGEGKLGHFCGVCAIRKCARTKQVSTCAHCDEYPSCEVDTWVKYPVLRRKIDGIRKELQADNS